jgi:uncharacterized spore protein YtfJ
MDLQELIGSARDAMTVRRVYGEPYEKDGLTIIPAAVLRGGVGGQSARTDGQPDRDRGGFGMKARPVGVFVVQNGVVRWQPAFDVGALLGTAVAGVAVLGAVLVGLFRRPRFRRVMALRRRSGRARLRAFIGR